MSDRFNIEIPDGDNLPRRVCKDCGWVDYVNPKIVVGAVCTFEDRFLMCRRAIEPRKGYWTFPAGYLELDESADEGARREVQEEACANVEIQSILAVYSLPHMSQIQIMYTARMLSPDFAPGPESEEVELVTWDKIHWDDLAFRTVRWALRHYDEVKGQDVFRAFTNPEAIE